jgi:transposase
MAAPSHQWAYLPRDLPPKSATYYYFARWRDDGTDQAIHDLLRCQARQKAGRAEDPSAVALDTQSIRAANHVPAATTWPDAAKKVPGRKRGLAVDTLGLILAVVVMAASATDNAIGVRLLDQVVAHTPTVTRAWVDTGFQHDAAIHGAVLGIDVELLKRREDLPGFTPIAKRWVVEQTNGALMPHRPARARVREQARLIGVPHTVGLDGQSRPPVDRHQHTVLARPGMNTATILDLIAAREAAATAAADDLRAQIAKLTGELAATESDLADLQITRQTLAKLTHSQVTAADPTITSEPYQQILAVFDPNGSGMRAKDVCLALGTGLTPKETEGIRAKLKRLVNRQILTETEPGLFTLTTKRT